MRKSPKRFCILTNVLIGERKERRGNWEVVIESKSLYNRFVDFAFFVVKNWKVAKDAKSAKGRGKSGEYFVLNGMVIALVAK